MNKNLQVIDMSPAIRAGLAGRTDSFIVADVIPTAEGYRELRIPTGGVSQLFNILAQYRRDSDIAFVADRPATIKKELYPDYKKSRTHSNLVNVGNEATEFIINDCGFNIYYRDGYEADDVIYSIVKYNHDKYETINVHTADSDLYLLCDDKVSIRPTSSKAKTITMENYCTAVRPGSYVPYNALSFLKFMEGARDKEIAPLSPSVCEEIAIFLNAHGGTSAVGDTETFINLIEQFDPEYVLRAKLFYPMYIDEDWTIADTGDDYKVRCWAHAVNNLRIPGIKADLSAEIERMKEQSLYLE